MRPFRYRSRLHPRARDPPLPRVRDRSPGRFISSVPAGPLTPISMSGRAFADYPNAGGSGDCIVSYVCAHRALTRGPGTIARPSPGADRIVVYPSFAGRPSVACRETARKTRKRVISESAIVPSAAQTCCSGGNVRPRYSSYWAGYGGGATTPR